MTDRLGQIAEHLLAFRRQPGEVHLYPHIGIDADALGSALALLRALRQSGVSARLLLDEPVPERLGFLPSLDLVEFCSDSLPESAPMQQLALLVDCSDGPRVGRRQALLDQAPQIAVLDHHVSGGDSGYLRWIDASAAATGEIVFDLIRILEASLQTNLMDEANTILLMTAIVSDTGGFVFSNTSARTFRTAASLMEKPVDLRKIAYQLFEMTSQERLRLMGRLFTDAHFSADGRLVLALADQSLLEATGATDNDLDGVITYLRNIGGVEVAFLIRGMRNGGLRVSIRSGEHFNAADFARTFGGGGHPRAAGLLLNGISLADAAGLILEKAGEWLSHT